jgi:hypothetical protein
MTRVRTGRDAQRRRAAHATITTGAVTLAGSRPPLYYDPPALPLQTATEGAVTVLDPHTGARWRPLLSTGDFDEVVADPPASTDDSGPTEQAIATQTVDRPGWHSARLTIASATI